MKYLMNQVELEQLLGLQESAEPVPDFAVIYFTATWCGACRSLDLDRLERTVFQPTWYKCDVDQNQYSPGYCNVRAIPTFVVIYNKKVQDTLQHNNTDKVIEWLQGHVKAASKN